MRRSVPLTVVGLALLALTLPAAPAVAAYHVPDDGVVRMTGRGFGHGHGMGQYGAEGAARKGRTYRQILSFYYPGTHSASRGSTIRVLLTADTTDAVTVKRSTGLYVRDLRDGRRFNLPPSVNRWRIIQASGNRALSQLQRKRKGRWESYRLPGRGRFLGDAEFGGSAPVRLVLPSGAVRTYRGRLRSASPSPSSTSRSTVNVVGLDLYVRGVIASEMPASWHVHALRAQAVAARTYAVQARSTRRKAWYHVCDTTACQVYGGMGSETSRTNAAVAATAHQVLTYRGSLAFTQFSASSGGWTSYGGRTYLPAKRDPYDDWSGNGVHRWRTTIAASSIQRAYPSLGKLRKTRVSRRDGNGEWGGRAEVVKLIGSKKTVTISGNTMRSVFGLRSTWFRFGG